MDIRVVHDPYMHNPSTLVGPMQKLKIVDSGTKYQPRVWLNDFWSLEHHFYHMNATTLLDDEIGMRCN